jgi:hypothetical protein
VRWYRCRQYMREFTHTPEEALAGRVRLGLGGRPQGPTARDAHAALIPKGVLGVDPALVEIAVHLCVGGRVRGGGCVFVIGGRVQWAAAAERCLPAARFKGEQPSFVRPSNQRAV